MNIYSYFRKFLTVFLVVVLLSAIPVLANAEKNSPKLQKIAEIYTYSSSDNTYRTDYSYDENGNLISLHSDFRGTKDEYYSYYPDGTMKQHNLVPVPDIFSDYYEFPYETHYDKYGTPIEWYVNYYSHAVHVCYYKGIPYRTGEPVTREYNEDGQITSFTATGPVVIYEWNEEGHYWESADHVDVSAEYQYDIQGRILYYTITRSEGDCSNTAFFEYHEDGSYTQHINIFGKNNKLISWCTLDFDTNKNLLCIEIHLWQSPYGFDYETVERNEYSYDEQGRQTSQRWLRDGQEQGGQYEYTDEPGKTVINYYNGWNNLGPSSSRVEILYDEYGYETERSQYTGNELWYTVKTEYQLTTK